MKKVNKTKANVLLLLVSIFLIFLLIEAGFCAYAWFFDYNSGIYRTIKNGEIGGGLIPDVKVKIKRPEFSTIVETNSQGIRDNKETPWEKRRGVTRILILGDSMVEAAQVNLEQTYTKIFESILNNGDNSTKFEIINAGCGGYAPYQEMV